MLGLPSRDVRHDIVHDLDDAVVVSRDDAVSVPAENEVHPSSLPSPADASET
jgi:hypothetical protein